MVELINEADVAAADRRAGLIRQAVAGRIVDIDFAGVWMFEKPGEMQQGGFAGTGGGNQRHHLTALQLEIRLAQNGKRRLALTIGSLDAGKPQHCFFCHIAKRSLFVTQGLHRIELGSTPGREDRCQERERQGHDDDGDGFTNIHFGRKLAEEIELRIKQHRS